MTGVDIVLAALAAGVTGGITEAASGAVRDSWEGLRDAVRRRLAHRGEDGARALAAYEAEPVRGRAALVAELAAAGAGEDRELVAAARALLGAMAGSGAKYQVDAGRAQGVQIGDRATQTNTFN